MSDLMDIPNVKNISAGCCPGVGVRYPLPYDAGTRHELLGGHVPDFVVDDTTLYAIMSGGRPVFLHTPQASAVREAAEPRRTAYTLSPRWCWGRPNLSAALIRPTAYSLGGHTFHVASTTGLENGYTPGRTARTGVDDDP